MLGGHKLNLQLSMKKDIAGSSAAKKAGKDKDKNAQATKVVVRNVAFEATSKEIRALFQPFGQIKSVRLPRKFDNSHRCMPASFPLPLRPPAWSPNSLNIGLHWSEQDNGWGIVVWPRWCWAGTMECRILWSVVYALILLRNHCSIDHSFCQIRIDTPLLILNCELYQG